MATNELFYQLALMRIENIGDIFARRLLQQFGTPENIFNTTEKQLLSIEGLGIKRVKSLQTKIDSTEIRKEIDFINKHQISTCFITENDFPPKLKACPDAPFMLFSKGNGNLLTDKTIAIVGTRKNTDYGQRMTEDLIEGLSDLDVVIVSGLAYGIDAIAHRKALQCGLKTFAVLAHGLDRIYPSAHKNIAKEIINQGTLITEYPSATNPDKQNFPMRNRIVAGMADVVVVVETDEKGGAMITAKLASSYNREVMAFPGRVTDSKSKGCNYLIKTNIAQTITCAQDLIYMMNWQPSTNKKSVQAKLFTNLTEDEKKLIEILKDKEAIHIDELMLKSNFNNSTLASLLLTLEFQNIVKSLPGKRYRLC